MFRPDPEGLNPKRLDYFGNFGINGLARFLHLHKTRWLNSTTVLKLIIHANISIKRNPYEDLVSALHLAEGENSRDFWNGYCKVLGDSYQDHRH